jgi:type IV secretory pathway TrbD component
MTPPKSSAAPARSASADDRALRDAAVVSFATTIVLLLAAYVAAFDVGHTAQRIIEGAAALGALTAAIAVHRIATPTRLLPHPAKIRREQRHLAMLTGVLAAVLLLLLYAAAFDLNSWAEWTVFGAFVLITVGGGIAAQTRLR